jgi:F-type H+-transporting ATPase subunit a
MEEHPGTWLNILERALPPQVQQCVTTNVLTAWLVLAVLMVFVLVGTRRMQLRPVSGLQVMWEWTVEAFAGFCKMMIGPGGEQYMPFLGTLFMYILVLNLLGIIPGFISPTASLTMTGALGLTAFVYVQICGFRAQGLKYLMHFVGEPLWLAPLNVPIHVIGELARPLSLSIRLFGNIFGEDVVIAQLLAMSAGIFAVSHLPIPLHFPMVLFHIFVSFVQALVFMMLTGAYIAGAVTHEGGEHEGGH